MDQKLTQVNLLGEAARKFISTPRKLLIGGDWVDAESGETFAVIDPATGEEVTRVAKAGPADIDRAARAARAAFESPAWREMRPSTRQNLLLKLADLIEENADELAQLEALDNGKTLMMARHGDLSIALDYLRYIAGWATKIEGRTIDVSLPYVPQEAKFFSYVTKEPVGVCGQIIPWNFPLVMAVWKLGPVLATGCTSILKPAEQTPLTALRLGELILEAGYPEGVVNIVTGFGDAGAALVDHPLVDKIAFTGSTEIGKIIGQNAMKSLKRVSLECGGKSPVVILGDTELPMAIEGAANAIFFNHGQVCTAGSRLYVERAIFDDVVDGIANIARNMKLGPGLDETTQMGPLVSEEQQGRVASFVERGREEGAEIVAGGCKVERPGYFLEPTVISNARQDMAVVQEEIFGPVVVAQAIDDLNEIPTLANDSVYGLAASIWTRDITKVHRLVPKIRAGTVWVNCHNLVDAALPFGGYKQSGFGREMGRDVIDLYTESKSVCIMV